MEITKVKLIEWPDIVSKLIRGGTHGINYAVVDCPMVLVHKAAHVDANTCNTLGYGVFETYHNGGAFVVNTGDIGVAHIGDLDNKWLDAFVREFVLWLKEQGLNVTYESNDILVDGYKVCGTSVTRYGRVDYTACVIGINTNLDHIKQICRKPMSKVPKGLADYGITTDEVGNWLLEFCKKN